MLQNTIYNIMNKILIIFSFLLLSCSQSSNEEANQIQDILTPDPIPPQNLTITQSSLTAFKNTAITPIRVDYFGNISRFRISRDLPNGLSLNEETGIISGTPLETINETQYIITVFNEVGFSTINFRLTVLDELPENLSYSNNNTIAIRGTSINSLVPSSTGGTITSYSITPNLPQGLSFNTSTGVISGTPLENKELTQYTITGSNNRGSVQTQVNITINGFAPNNLSYNVDSYKTGDRITLIPNYTGDASEFSINPALPSGLNINTNGIIQGKILEEIDENFIVTATNEFGSTSYNLNLTATAFISKIINTSKNTCFILSGQLYCSGDNEFNQVDADINSDCDNSICRSRFVLQKNNDDSKLLVKDFSLTDSGSLCIINIDDDLLCKGNNQSGELGQENLVQLFSNEWLNVKRGSSNVSNVTKLKSGKETTCYLQNNRLYCFGKNNDNVINSTSTNLYSSPQEITLQSNSLTVLNFDIGYSHLCLFSNKLYCQGNNLFSQLSHTNGFNLSPAKNILDQDINNIDFLSLGFSSSFYGFEDNYYFVGENVNNSGGLLPSMNSPLKFSLSNHERLTFFKETSCFIKNQNLQCFQDDLDNIFSFNNNILINFEGNEEGDITQVSKNVIDYNKCYSKDTDLYCGGNNINGSLGRDPNIYGENITFPIKVYSLNSLSSVFKFYYLKNDGLCSNCDQEISVDLDRMSQSDQFTYSTSIINNNELLTLVNNDFNSLDQVACEQIPNAIFSNTCDVSNLSEINCLNSGLFWVNDLNTQMSYCVGNSVLIGSDNYFEHSVKSINSYSYLLELF